ncbi:MAG: hypothetical protein A3G24_04970 [Betaproteobacteria bacterium RIFCSPLOWO2_12_FULL_62_13]|nr:MAG: hypothetical protein A3G24_04970 [Betaproteobacteria bacterium RIFCSPLOWO2_12_FULL_62_13]
MDRHRSGGVAAVDRKACAGDEARARCLREIFEELITPILDTVPDDPTMRRVEIESLFTEPRYIRKG